MQGLVCIKPLQFKQLNKCTYNNMQMDINVQNNIQYYTQLYTINNFTYNFSQNLLSSKDVSLTVKQLNQPATDVSPSLASLWL